MQCGGALGPRSSSTKRQQHPGQAAAAVPGSGSAAIAHPPAPPTRKHGFISSCRRHLACVHHLGRAVGHPAGQAARRGAPLCEPAPCGAAAALACGCPPRVTPIHSSTHPPDEHEVAAARPAGHGVADTLAQRGGYGGIHRAAALSQHGGACGGAEAAGPQAAQAAPRGPARAALLYPALAQHIAVALPSAHLCRCSARGRRPPRRPRR